MAGREFEFEGTYQELEMLVARSKFIRNRLVEWEEEKKHNVNQ